MFVSHINKLAAILNQHSRKKMEVQDPEKEIIELIEKTKSLIPLELVTNLKINPLTKLPDWHNFEHQIWKNGENIRQILLANKKLKNNENLFESLLEIATNRNAKRGRQSFILLFGNVKYSKYSSELIKQIDDEFVDGHIIDTIYRMKNNNYIKEILPFCSSKFTWIKNTAKKYVEKFESQVEK